MFVSRKILMLSAVVAVVLSACCGYQPAASACGDASSAEGASAPAAAPSGEADITTRLAGADLKRGQTMYFQCRACHSLEEGGANKVGPNLHGVFGRKAGLTPGFAYSEALTESDVVWTIEAMDEWLARPSQFLPGNRMVFIGVKDAQDRASLIAYMQQETGAL